MDNLNLHTPPVNRYLIAGQLKLETIFPFKRPPVLNQAGGNLLHAAGGVSLWDTGVSLLSRVGKNFPLEKLKSLRSFGWDLSGIKQLSIDLDHRSFIAYENYETLSRANPIDLFSQAGLVFPKELIGFQLPSDALDSRINPNSFSLKANDIPDDFLDATAAHICPLDYLSHSLLPPILRQGHLSTVTLEPGPGYMHPTFLDALPGLLNGITAFLPDEQNALNLFQGRTNDLLEISNALASSGCEIIVIQRGSRGCFLYDHTSHSRWIIPAS